MKNGEDRRQFKRVPVRMPVRIFAPAVREPINGEILNISEGGAFISASHQLQEGQNVLLEVQFSELELLHSRVTSWKEQLPPPDGDAKEDSVVRWIHEVAGRGFGVQFIDLSPTAKDFIKKLVSYFDRL